MRGPVPFNTAAAWALTALLLSNTGRQEPEVTVLTPGEPIQRHIARGEEHRFQLVLDSNESAGLVVEQRGIDIGIFVRDSEGTPICDFQDEVRRDAEERGEIVATRAGTYIVAIKPADSAVTPGDYVIRITAAREATDADRRLQ